MYITGALSSHSPSRSPTHATQTGLPLLPSRTPSVIKSKVLRDLSNRQFRVPSDLLLSDASSTFICRHLLSLESKVVLESDIIKDEPLTVKYDGILLDAARMDAGVSSSSFSSPALWKRQILCRLKLEGDTLVLKLVHVQHAMLFKGTTSSSDCEKLKVNLLASKATESDSFDVDLVPDFRYLLPEMMQQS